MWKQKEVTHHGTPTDAAQVVEESFGMVDCGLVLCAGACGCYGYSADQQKSLPLWSSGDKEMNAHQDRWRQVSGEKGWGRGGPKAALRRWHCSRELKEMSDEAGGHWE